MMHAIFSHLFNAYCLIQFQLELSIEHFRMNVMASHLLNESIRTNNQLYDTYLFLFF